MTWWEWTLAGLAIALVIYGAFVLWLIAAGRRDEARAVATFIPDCIVLVSRLAGDHRVPRRRKLMLFALAGYLAMPFDLVPDFIPVAGVLDDAVIVIVVLRHLVRRDPALLFEHWPGPRSSLALLLRLVGASDRVAAP
jgi:uncharacterized membrane protein YkvA (DUF1232 family)